MNSRYTCPPASVLPSLLSNTLAEWRTRFVVIAVSQLKVRQPGVAEPQPSWRLTSGPPTPRHYFLSVATMISYVIYRVKVTSFSLRLIKKKKSTWPFWEVTTSYTSECFWRLLCGVCFRRDGPAGRWRGSDTLKTWSSRFLMRRQMMQMLLGETPPPTPRSQSSRSEATCVWFSCVLEGGPAVL